MNMSQDKIYEIGNNLMKMAEKKDAANNVYVDTKETSLRQFHDAFVSKILNLVSINKKSR